MTARPKQRQTSTINDKNVNHPFTFVESHVQGIFVRGPENSVIHPITHQILMDEINFVLTWLDI